MRRPAQFCAVAAPCCPLQCGPYAPRFPTSPSATKPQRRAMCRDRSHSQWAYGSFLQICNHCGFAATMYVHHKCQKCFDNRSACCTRCTTRSWICCTAKWLASTLGGNLQPSTLHQPKKLRTSAIASARPQRLTGASGGRALRRREGVAGSSITKHPLSCWLRMRRPKACFNLSRVSRSS
jgi:hypothetical protein